MASNVKKGTGGSDKNAPRITALEKKAGVPHEVQDFLERLSGKSTTASIRAAKTFAALSNATVAPAQVVDVIFDLDSTTTAKVARVYLPGSQEDIANSQNPHGVLRNQVVGTFVTVVIQVGGEPSDIGVFDIQHAQPSSIRLRVSNGPTGTKPLLVTP
jgi:hypothetical protein